MSVEPAGEPPSRPSVAYLGPPSSYTHQATAGSFDAQDYNLEPCGSIRDVFQAVHTGSSAYGVVPFENSSNGAVLQTLDIFRSFPSLTVTGETYIAVHHCLLGLAQSASSPSTAERLQHVRKIYSHPQAFGQCEGFLAAHLKGVERQEVSSTSRAAQIVVEGKGKGEGQGEELAISSRMAAEVLGLEVLAEGIEDAEDNETRFIVLQREGQSGQLDGVGAKAEGEAKDWKTFVSFTIDHGKTGALGGVLNLFAEEGLNLTSINSRPGRTKPWNYIFFVELEGRKQSDGQGVVNRALERLMEASEWCHWHGSWKKRGGV